MSALSQPDAPAYTSSAEHLREAFQRIDLLVRAQTRRWRAAIGGHKPEQLWGMIHVSDAEIDAFLASSFALPATVPVEDAGRLAEHIQARCRVTPPEVPLHLVKLQSVFGLTASEVDILLICILPELDPRYRRLFGYLQDDASRTRPSVELALQIAAPPDAGRELFEGSRPLLANRLLIDALPDEPLPMRPIRADDRIVSYLLHGDASDASLRGIVRLAQPGVAWDDLITDAPRLARLQSLGDWLAGAPRAAILLHGSYGSGRLQTARALCGAAGCRLLTASLAAALRAPEGFDRVIELVLREARLREAALFWSDFQVLLAPELAPRLAAFLPAAQAFAGLTFLATSQPWVSAGFFHEPPLLRLECPNPTYPLRLRLWERCLPPALPNRDSVAADLANGFQLTPGQMVDALAAARALALARDPAQPEVAAADLFEACRRQSGGTLVTFARRIEPRTELTFDDLVLPDPSRRQLLELRARIRNRSRVLTGLGFERWLTLGRGLIAMFTGASGTGKTMSAELLAREQGVDLYKVDLSEVVSKYVGETEKNLSRVFDEAEDSNAIIFFDEADALFGKRGDVKEAKDRWANIEVNFLLQRVEEYSGVVILASNLRQNIDEAFLRRIHVIVDFPSPDAAMRARIWNGMFPAGVDRPSDAQLRPLAERFCVAGGSIRNIVVDAAFRAIEEAPASRPAITVRHLVLGIAREYQKLGKPITKGEFEAEYYSWVEKDLL